MAARKFSDAQISLLEKEYNAGLNSTSVIKFGDRICGLAEKADIEISDVKTWINNRKRGAPPTCFPMDQIQPNPPKKQQLKAPPIRKRPSGYNLFSGQLFANGKKTSAFSRMN